MARHIRALRPGEASPGSAGVRIAARGALPGLIAGMPCALCSGRNLTVMVIGPGQVPRHLRMAARAMAGPLSDLPPGLSAAGKESRFAQAARQGHGIPAARSSNSLGLPALAEAGSPCRDETTGATVPLRLAGITPVLTIEVTRTQCPDWSDSDCPGRATGRPLGRAAGNLTQAQ